jgi:hypothetical protein
VHARSGPVKEPSQSSLAKDSPYNKHWQPLVSISPRSELAAATSTVAGRARLACDTTTNTTISTMRSTLGAPASAGNRARTSAPWRCSQQGFCLGIATGRLGQAMVAGAVWHLGPSRPRLESPAARLLQRRWRIPMPEQRDRAVRGVSGRESDTSRTVSDLEQCKCITRAHPHTKRGKARTTRGSGAQAGEADRWSSPCTADAREYPS